MPLTPELGQTLNEFVAVLPKLGALSINEIGDYKTADGKTFLDTVNIGVINVHYADLGLKGVIAAEIIQASDISAGAVNYQFTLGSPIREWDKSSSDYIADTIEISEDFIPINAEIYKAERFKISDMMRLGIRSAAVMGSAIMEMNRTFEFARTLYAVEGMLTKAGDAAPQKVVIAKPFEATDAELKAMTNLLRKEINAFQIQVNRYWRGTNNAQIRLLISPETNKYLVQIFGQYPTMFGQTVVQDGLVTKYLGIETTECFVLGQTYAKYVNESSTPSKDNAAVSYDKAFDFSSTDFCLVVTGGKFKSPTFNYAPTALFDESISSAKLYRGYRRAALMNKNGGKWIYTDKNDTNPKVRVLRRFKYYTS